MTSKPSTGTPRWGIADALLWLLASQVLSVIWALILIAAFFDGDVPDDAPVWLLVVGAIPLWFCYGFGPIATSRRRGAGPTQDFGTWFANRDVPMGLAIGVATQFLILPILYFPILYFVDSDPSEAAEALVGLVNGPVDVVLLVFLVAVAAPVVEELFFRGLFLRALERQLGPWPAVFIQALVFAGVHFQMLQFAGLFVFGLIAGGLTLWTGRLAPAWAMHFAFNSVTLMVLLS